MAAGHSIEPIRLGSASGVDESDPLDGRLREVRRYCLHLLNSRFSWIPAKDREDLAQEVCVQFWMHSEQVEDLDAYTYVSTRNKAISWLRTRRLREGPPAEASGSAVTEGDPTCFSPEETIQALYFTLERSCRKILGQLYYGEQSIRRLAVATGTNARKLTREHARCLKVLLSRWKGHLAVNGGER